jgi:hypothetical protein
MGNPYFCAARVPLALSPMSTYSSTARCSSAVDVKGTVRLKEDANEGCREGCNESSGLGGNGEGNGAVTNGGVGTAVVAPGLRDPFKV